MCIKLRALLFGSTSSTLPRIGNAGGCGTGVDMLGRDAAMTNPMDSEISKRS
jgi:hypothetical protein